MRDRTDDTIVTIGSSEIESAGSDEEGATRRQGEQRNPAQIDGFETTTTQGQEPMETEIPVNATRSAKDADIRARN